jgi:hypothetical protein
MRKNLQDLTPADVQSAYVGRVHTCCCGCAGTHYDSSEPGFGDSDRAMLLKILRTVQANEENLNSDGPRVWSANVGKKVFIVYLREDADAPAVAS